MLLVVESVRVVRLPPPGIGEHGVDAAVGPPFEFLVGLRWIRQGCRDVTGSAIDDFVWDGDPGDVFHRLDDVEHRYSGAGAEVELIASGLQPVER